MDKKKTSELEKMWQIEKYCEDEIKCPKCKDYTLVGCDFKSILLLCSRCGEIYTFDTKTKKLIKCEEK